jgi:hypothetical protein
MGAVEKMYRYSPYIIGGDLKVYQYSSENGSRNPTNMVTEWKVCQYSYKKGCNWKNVRVQSVDNWRRIESVPVQFRKWALESEKMAAEWKVYQYIYKNGRGWKNVRVLSVNNWHGFERVPVQFIEWAQTRDQYQFCCKMLCRGEMAVGP